MLIGNLKSMALVRVCLGAVSPGSFISAPCEVKDPLKITEGELKKISYSACIEKVEGKLVFTEGGNKSCD